MRYVFTLPIMDIEINKEKLNSIQEPFEPLKNAVPENKYVAFIDILGFGNQVINKFENTISIYQEILGDILIVEVVKTNVSIQIYSDSIVLSSEELHHLILVVNTVLMQTLRRGFLARGGIGFGNHVEVHDGHNFYIISQALVNAAIVEKSIKYPCVAIHDSVRIPEEYWMGEVPPILRTILHFEGISLVSPLNMFWGTSAIGIASYLSEQYPKHKGKYDWFLRLCEAIFREEKMVPNIN